MPNWVSNEIEVVCSSEERLDELLKYVESSESVFDFNNIMPMPKSLNIEEGSITDLALAAYRYDVLKDDKLISEILTYPWVKSKGIKTCDELLSHLYKMEGKEKLLRYGEIYTSNEIMYGFRTWYDWCIKNWGTKWNACHAEVNGNIICFDTAWCPVPNIFVALSEKFSDVQFEYTYVYEEGIHGYMSIANGEILIDEDDYDYNDD